MNGRFQLRSDSPKYLPGKGWTWLDNPFVGTRELQGLKILVLLVSNWDTKDARDFVTVRDPALSSFAGECRIQAKLAGRSKLPSMRRSLRRC